MIRAVESATFPGVWFDACACDWCGAGADAYIAEHSPEAVLRLAEQRLRLFRGWRTGFRSDGKPAHACPSCVARIAPGA